ncbi:MAG: GIY-YIG nuclease family protein [Ignavibacteria bacterium]|nr:GIY-YIG nuclease family protein [Ignavibacteria bacterium]
MRYYFVYILTNKRNGTLYIGVTNNLLRRVKEHKDKIVKGFTEKYNVDKLVYYEQTENVHSAISREKILKKWERKWKLELIEKENPEWKDLYYELGGI